MTYHFAVCDDEPAWQRNLERMIRKWADTNGFNAHVTCFPSAETFLFRYAEDKSYDVLLLDIEMAEMNGVQLARIVRSENKEVQIVFITGYMDYIADGYDVEALHYLMKPIVEEKLFGVLDRAAARMKENEKALILDLGNECVRIPLYEVKYFEVQRNYVTVHADRDHTFKSTLRELEAGLDKRFMRIGRSFIINLKCIRKVTRVEIFLNDGACIPLPRGVYDAVNRAMIERL